MNWKKHFYHWYYYTQSQKRGFIAFLVVVFLLQGTLYLYYHRQPITRKEYAIGVEEQQRIQIEIDRLRLLNASKKDTIYPFNPNYLTDYKGYLLELTPEEIDRLLAYRAMNQYVNSNREFQQVTAVSDEWMEKYSVYFVFASRPQRAEKQRYSQSKLTLSSENTQAKAVRDINLATAESLQETYGIGPVLSKRILDDRNKWGGYVHIDQVKFVYGLSEEVIASLLQQYAVLTPLKVNQIDLNNAGIDDLKNIPYLNYYLARELVKYRSLHGDFVNKEQLREIEKIPLDKIHIISLYLEIRN